MFVLNVQQYETHREANNPPNHYAHICSNTAGTGELPVVAARVFATKPPAGRRRVHAAGGSAAGGGGGGGAVPVVYEPLDLYWDAKRRDFQTVGSDETRRW